MKCGKCGFDFYEGVFCPECGTKYDERESQIKVKEEMELEEERKKEEKLNKELELAKAKADQERLEKERIEHEAELLKQKNENLRLKEEAKEKERIAEQERQEKLSRTLYGKVYDTVEEKEAAARQFSERESIDSAATWCFGLSILTYFLTLTLIGWIPSLYKSFSFGIKALKGKTDRKALVYAGFILNILFIIALIYGTLIELGYLPEA